MAEPARIAVLASGGGSNFQALADHFNRPGGPEAAVVGVIASRRDAGVLERAHRAGVKAAVQPRTAAAEEVAMFLLDTFNGWRSDIVVLAGYVKLVPEAVVRAWRGRMVNIHPALLPSFGGKGMYGAHVHRAVLEAGTRVSGVTVHFVDRHYDRGPILCQWPVPVLAGDTPESLAARVLAVEHRLLPAAVEALAAGDVRLTEDGRAEWRREWFGAETFTNRSREDE